jgi:hypothetical protein
VSNWCPVCTTDRSFFAPLRRSPYALARARGLFGAEPQCNSLPISRTRHERLELADEIVVPTPSDLSREIFAVIGAIIIAATAWTRLAASPPAVSAGPGRPALSEPAAAIRSVRCGRSRVSSFARSKSHARCAHHDLMVGAAGGSVGAAVSIPARQKRWAGHTGLPFQEPGVSD